MRKAKQIRISEEAYHKLRILAFRSNKKMIDMVDELLKVKNRK